MNIVEKLDLAIKLKEIGTIEGSYVIPYKNGTRTKKKSTYMKNEEWDAFFAAMPASVRKEYGKGGGDELSEKNGRPPKMASYGSSSRMIYMLSRQKENFHYEEKLPTTVGGQANLDGFYKGDGYSVFVEAKCHEPYTVKRNVVSQCYAGVYQYINEHMHGNVRIEMTPNKNDHYMNVDYFAKGERLDRFDMKQMICHLLGIATGMLKGTLERWQTDFIYLLYDPTELSLAPDAKEEIDRIYSRTCYECSLVDFADLFRVLLDFLKVTKYPNAMSDEEADTVTDRFTFTLASQELYKILISYATKSKNEETFYITKDRPDGTKEVVFRLKCTREEALSVFDFVIREQQKERRRSEFTVAWRIIRLFDSETDAQICQES